MYKKQTHKSVKMTLTRHNKILYTWKKLTKNEMRIKENKDKKFSKLENKKTLKIMKIWVTNLVSVKRVYSKLFVDSMKSLDKLSMLMLNSAEKLGSP